MNKMRSFLSLAATYLHGRSTSIQHIRFWASKYQRTDLCTTISEPVRIFTRELSVQSAREWSYFGKTGPEFWRGDSKKKQQSPINIETDQVEYLSSLDTPVLTGYDDEVGAVEMQNNGHSVSIKLPEKTISGRELMLKLPTVDENFWAHSFHFHWGTRPSCGSEHTVDGKCYPMELHIVHVNSKYESLESAVNYPEGLAVLGFFYEETREDNESYKKLIDNFKEISEEGSSTAIRGFTLTDLLADADLTKYYRYHGSLTTPPCSEAVTWTVFRDAIPIGAKQMAAFRQTICLAKEMQNNFRPVQPLNGRRVYASFQKEQ